MLCYADVLQSTGLHVGMSEDIQPKILLGHSVLTRHPSITFSPNQSSF